MAIPEIRLLEAAIALAEDLNFTRAAQRLHIDQSTLSRRIFDLETQLGFRLFERNHQIVEITDSGRKFVEEAREALFHAERAVLSATSALRGVDETLNIGRSAHTDPYVISMLMSVRLALFPRLKTKFWSNHAPELVHDLMSGRLDIALISGNLENPQLSCLVVADEPFYVAFLDDDALALKREIGLSDLSHRNWILFSRQVSPELYDAFQLQAFEAKITSSDQHQVMTPEEAIPLILAHEGVAVLNRAGAWRIAQHGITLRPLAETNVRLRTSLAVRANNKSRLVAEFIRSAGRKLEGVRRPIQQRLNLTA